MASAADKFRDFYKNIILSKNFGANYATDKPAAASSVFNAPIPNFKGMDFATGQRDVDLGQYSNLAIGTEPPFAQQPEKTTPEFKPEKKSSTEGFADILLDPRFQQYRELESQRRREENLFDAALTQQMFQSYLPEMRRTALETRAADYGYGLMADIQSPTRQQARTSAAQQQMATAAGAEAGMLQAVNEAAYKNAMANITGLRSGMRRG